MARWSKPAPTEWLFSEPQPAAYPVVPGSKGDVSTSQEAASAMETRAAILRDKVYRLLLSKPLTSHEVADELGESDKSTSPRISELRKLGLVVATGIRRLNKSGKPAAEWSAVPRKEPVS